MEKLQINIINKTQNGLKQSKNGKSSTLPRNFAMIQLLKYIVQLSLLFVASVCQNISSDIKKQNFWGFFYHNRSQSSQLC